MDITDALAPVSDQLDAIELVQPRTFTIDAGSRLGKREGKTVAEIRLVGFDRVWRPAKSMLDVLAQCWTTDAKTWVGHQITLYNDPEVRFGPDKVGGVRIKAMSHIGGKARDVSVRAPGQGRKQNWHVEPLPDEPAAPSAPTADTIAACDDLDQLRAWHRDYPDLREQITARATEIKAFAADAERLAARDAEATAP